MPKNKLSEIWKHQWHEILKDIQRPKIQVVIAWCKVLRQTESNEENAIKIIIEDKYNVIVYVDCKKYEYKLKALETTADTHILLMIK
jgi:hypothetical protein